MMRANTSKKQSSDLILQLVFNFIVPIFVLTRLSTPQSLGPAWGLVVALIFPTLYELYSIYKRRKVNLTSVIVIGGILVTGALGLLRVNEVWMALRRAVPYVLIALALGGSELLGKPLLKSFLNQIIDLEKVEKFAKQKHTELKVKRLYIMLSWLLFWFFLAIAASSYTLTRVILESPPLSAGFNEELGQLRIYSIGGVTVPLILGSVGLLLYLFIKLEKLTGHSTEEITKVK